MPTANVNGLGIEYDDSGAGVPVVFVPDFAGSMEWFRYQASGLSDHCRVIRCDLRGAPLRGAYSVELHADDIAALLRTVRVHSAVIVGVGFGGMIGVQFAYSHENLCAGLVLAGSAPSFARMSEDEVMATLAPDRIATTHPVTSFLRRVLRIRPTVEQDYGDDARAFLARSNAGLDHRTLRARLRLMRNNDMSELLQSISVPSLVVVGSREAPQVLAGSQLLDEALPNSRLEVIEDADHFGFFLRHDLFNEILMDFLTHRIKSL